MTEREHPGRPAPPAGEADDPMTERDERPRGDGHTHGHHHDHRHDHSGGGGGGGQEHPRGRAGAVKGVFSSVLHPHRHDPAGSLDAALDASAQGMRALKLSHAGLAATAAVQVVVVASGSVALLADSIHNLADALTALPLAVAFWLGHRPPATPTATGAPRTWPVWPSSPRSRHPRWRRPS